MLKLLEIDENLRAKTRSPTEMYSINETVAALLNLEISAFCGLFGVQLSTDKNVEQLKTEANMYIWAQALLDSCCHDFEQVDVVPKIGMKAMELLADQNDANNNNKMWCIRQMLLSFWSEGRGVFTTVDGEHFLVLMNI